MTTEFNMRSGLAKLTPGHLIAYLQKRGWHQAGCPLKGRVRLIGPDDGEKLELTLPSSRSVPRASTLLQRAVYTLCGIEDREVGQILPDVFAEFEADSAIQTIEPSGRKTIRIRNSSNSLLRVQLKSRGGEHELLFEEAIELKIVESENGVPEIEHRGTLLIIHDQ